MDGSGRRFDEVALPHLDAAFNYARWLSGNSPEAEDVVQDAFLRALRYFESFRGGDARAWLLAIVRNTFHSRPRRQTLSFDARQHDRAASDVSPELALVRGAEDAAVRSAVEALPADFREVLVLREFEGMSYKEIAEVTGVPVGTVMSRLARARGRVAEQLGAPRREGVERGVR
jgi:RNA polymerase sigma-70 factor (ECF subfamily)